MNVKSCARCGGDHENLEVHNFVQEVMPRRSGAVWIEFLGEDVPFRERLELLRSKLNSAPGSESIVWRDLGWNKWATCPTNGDPILVYDVPEYGEHE